MRMSALLLSIILLAPSSALAQTAPGSQDVIRAFIDAWNAHDPEAVGSLCTADAEYLEVASGKVYKGPEGCAEYARSTFAGAPDFHLDVLSVFRTGDWAASEWVMDGTQTGDWPSIPATGRHFSVRGVSIIELQDEHLRRVRDYWDLYTLMVQLGVLPAAPDSI